MTRDALIVLPPEHDGAKVYIDDVGGGHDVIVHVGEFPEATARVALIIGSDCRDAWTYIRAELDGYKPYTRHGVLLRAGVDRQVRIGVAEDPSRYGDTILPALQPVTSTVSRALVGPLRVVHHSASRTHSYADDTGSRRVLFGSWFCALRDWHDDQATAVAVLDRFVLAGYQGIRIFRFLGESDSSGYFAGRAVLPEWSVEALLGFLAACQARGLRVQLTCGRQWGVSERMAAETRCAQAIRSAGLSLTVSLWEGDNEGFQNAPMRDSPEQFAFYKDLFAMVRGTLTPAPSCACGAPEDESPNNLYLHAQHSDVLEKHGNRDEDRCVKRAFTPWYWEGDPGHFGIPMWEGEPKPYLSPDAFAATPYEGRVVAVLAMNQLVGNAVTFFSGEAVRGRDPSVAAGFMEVPRLLTSLPENVAESDHVPGGNIWWWSLPDGRFATVCDFAYWGPSAMTPPRPVKSYQIIGPRWSISDQVGSPAGINDGGAALIVGEFA